MTSTCQAPGCGRPVQDATICATCTGKLHAALYDVIGSTAAHGLWLDLELTLTRRARFGASGQRGTGTPVPWNQRAAEAIDVLRSTLAGWVRELVDDRRPAYGPICRSSCRHPSCAVVRRSAWPADRIESMAAWLLDRAEDIRQHPAAGEAVDEIRSAIGQARRAVDRPPQRVYAGRCKVCRAAIYAWPGEGTVVCRAPEHFEPISYDVDELRGQMLDEVADQLVPAAQAVHLLGLLGVPVTKVQVHRWAHGTERQPDRVRLWPHGRDASGRALYRVGDVQELALEHAQRRAHRVTAKAS